MNPIRVDWGKLSPAQRDLVNEYLRTGNKIASYMKVYRAPGDARTRAAIDKCYKIFRKPHVKAVIEQIQEEAIQRAQIRADELIQADVSDIVERHQRALLNATWILERTAQLASFNISSFIKVNEATGEAVYDFSEATEADWYCIQEVSCDPLLLAAKDNKDDPIPVNKVKIKSYDKLRALELMGKHVDIGAFKEKVELSGDEKNPVQTVTRKIVKSDGNAD